MTLGHNAAADIVNKIHMITTIHEASHCVIACQLSRKFYSVTVVPMNDYRGRVLGLHDAYNLDHALDNAVIFCAGTEGEKIYLNDSDRKIPEYSGDYKNLVQMVSHAYGPQNFDIGLWSTQSRCKRMLIENWPKVERVANALMEYKTLTFDEVKKLIL
jgi:hypothetical protein